MAENGAFEGKETDMELTKRYYDVTMKDNNGSEIRSRRDDVGRSYNITSEDQIETSATKVDLHYTIDEVPPWYLCILLGFQHYLTMFGATLSIPFFLASSLCIANNSLAQSEILSTVLFVSGLVTLLQATVGVRLPIVQGGSFSFLTPTFAILALDKWQCPEAIQGPVNTTVLPELEDDEIWKSRIREIQGAIVLSSLFQIVIGMLGIVGFLLNYIGPLAIAPTITLVGLALFEEASGTCAVHWWIALSTVALITIFSQYMRNITIPSCLGSNERLAFFQLFPVILAIASMWLLCGILTWTNALPDDKDTWGYGARVDIKSQVIKDAKWFRFPYPFQWGIPTFSLAGVFGMLSGVLAGMMESVGDYYACARLSGAPPPPVHAINRGILTEGLGCLFAGMWGTGNGTTSYSENIGAIGITKVGSRRVIQAGAVILMLLGMLAKFAAVFVSIPEPIVGGVFMIMFAMITAVGVSNLQYVDMNSGRNLFIFGFSTFFGLSFPKWVGHNPISVGNDELDQIITVLCSTSMFVGGTVAFFLDNTIPGTDEERGILKWRTVLTGSGVSEATKQCYDIPLVSNWLARWRVTHYIPFLPAFRQQRNVD